jgi:hypothetical protein
MSTKRDALMQVIGKVGKILPLLASDKAGEVTGAAGRLVQVLASVHLDLHDVTALLKEEPVAKPTNALFETDPEALLRIASDGASFFLDLDHVAYADIDVDGHRETWAADQSRILFLADAAVRYVEKPDSDGDPHEECHPFHRRKGRFFE